MKNQIAGVDFYTFTRDELEQLLTNTLRTFCRYDGVYDFSPDAATLTIEATLADLDDEPIPFDGSSVTYATDDNISLTELGFEEI